MLAEFKEEVVPGLTSRKGKILVQKIKSMSVAELWDDVCDEWYVEDAYEVAPDEDGNTEKRCTCTHHNLRFVGVVRNKLTKETAEVGSECIKHFLGVDARRICKDLDRAPAHPVHPETLEWALDRGYVDREDYTFYRTVLGRRVLTPSESERVHRINDKIRGTA